MHSPAARRDETPAAPRPVQARRASSPTAPQVVDEVSPAAAPRSPGEPAPISKPKRRPAAAEARVDSTQALSSPSAPLSKATVAAEAPANKRRAARTSSAATPASAKTTAVSAASPAQRAAVSVPAPEKIRARRASRSDETTPEVTATPEVERRSSRASVARPVVDVPAVDVGEPALTPLGRHSRDEPARVGKASPAVEAPALERRASRTSAAETPTAAKTPDVSAARPTQRAAAPPPAPPTARARPAPSAGARPAAEISASKRGASRRSAAREPVAKPIVEPVAVVGEAAARAVGRPSIDAPAPIGTTEPPPALDPPSTPIGKATAANETAPIMRRASRARTARAPADAGSETASDAVDAPAIGRRAARASAAATRAAATTLDVSATPPAHRAAAPAAASTAARTRPAASAGIRSDETPTTETPTTDTRAAADAASSGRHSDVESVESTQSPLTAPMPTSPIDAAGPVQRAVPAVRHGRRIRLSRLSLRRPHVVQASPSATSSQGHSRLSASPSRRYVPPHRDPVRSCSRNSTPLPRPRSSHA